MGPYNYVYIYNCGIIYITVVYCGEKYPLVVTNETGIVPPSEWPAVEETLFRTSNWHSSVCFEICGSVSWIQWISLDEKLPIFGCGLIQYDPV
jgi:hypothetical protein